MLTPQDVVTITNLVDKIVTPHDRFEDGVILFNFLMILINSVTLFQHVLAHRRWRESEPGREQKGMHLDMAEV